jgi:hypothetical protein
MSTETSCRWLCLFSCSAAVLLLACASKSKVVTISSTPSGARVELNGEYLGPSPITQELRFDPVPEYLVVARVPVQLKPES